MTLYNNYDINYTEWFEEFKDYCECNDIDHTQYDEDSEFFLDWVNDTLSMDWDDLMANIKYSDANTACVVLGSVGTWQGNREIAPTRFDTLIKAIDACVQHCDYIVIESNDESISVIGHHHDGTNSFNIYKLNEQGVELDYDDDEFNLEKHTEKFSSIY